MVTKKKSSKKSESKSKSSKKTKKKEEKKSKKSSKKEDKKNLPTLELKSENDIALDFATKTYKKFDKSIKAIVLFGSTAKKTRTAGSDIDIIIIIDDVTINWDQELTAWYRQELNQIINENPYNRSLHINTVKLSTWWDDMIRGDPIVLNIIRHGEPLIDLAGFFNPLKYLLIRGKIKATPEAVYSALQRAPDHLARSRSAVLGAIEGLYWCMVDSSHAALIAGGIFPPSPEHISEQLRINFVEKKLLKSKYVQWFKDIKEIHKKITRGKLNDLKGVEMDELRENAEEFLEVMAKLVKEIIENKSYYNFNENQEESNEQNSEKETSKE
jgi:predicted nucleotidyltransferase